MDYMFNATLDLLLIALVRIKAGDSEGATTYLQQAVSNPSFDEDVAELEDLQSAAAKLEDRTYDPHFDEDEDDAGDDLEDDAEDDDAIGMGVMPVHASADGEDDDDVEDDEAPNAQTAAITAKSKKAVVANLDADARVRAMASNLSKLK